MATVTIDPGTGGLEIPSPLGHKPDMEINGIAHVMLTVRSVEASRTFYVGLLERMGLTRMVDTPAYLYYVGGRTAVGLRPAEPGHAGEPFVQRVVLNVVRMRHRAATRREAREAAWQLSDAATPAEIVERVELQRAVAGGPDALQPVAEQSSGPDGEVGPSKDRCPERGPRKTQRVACDLRLNDARTNDVQRTCAQLTTRMLEPTPLWVFFWIEFRDRDRSATQ
ncbi:MAG TPA: VOC family protein [Kofleriaceae bacterium]|nr:VOC family protein [Kofleriaceae bacterium]